MTILRRDKPEARHVKTGVIYVGKTLSTNFNDLYTPASLSTSTSSHTSDPLAAMSSSSSPRRTPESKTSQILRGSSGRTEEANLPGPLRWIVELIQRMIAVLFIVIGDSIKMVFSDDKSRTRTGRHQMEVDAKKALGSHPDKPLEARDFLPKKDD